MNRARAITFAIPAGLVVILATGCSSASQSAPGPVLDSAAIKARADIFREEGRDVLAEMFADGAVDSGDYQVAFDAFRECMISRGYEAPSPALSPADGLRYIVDVRADGKSEAEAAKDQEECRTDLGEVEAMYSATNEQVMAPELRSSLVHCMNETDLVIAADARNYPEMVESSDQSQQWHEGFGACLGSAREALYPDLPYLVVGY